MGLQDIKDSMTTPNAPAFDGNGSGPLSGGIEGKVIHPTKGAMARVGREPDAAQGSVEISPNPCGPDVGLMAPVQGLEGYGSGKVIDAPSSQAKVTPDTKIVNLDPLASDKTPGYGGGR